MNVLYIVLLSIVYVDSQQLNSTSILRLGNMKNGKYASGSDPVPSVNSSVTVAPVNDTPKVKAVKRHVEDDYSNSKLTSLAQKNFKIQKQQYNNNKQPTQVPHNSLVKSFLEAQMSLQSKNKQNNEGSFQKSSTKSGNINHPTTINSSLRVNNYNNTVFKRAANDSIQQNATTHKNISAEHLKALKNVIALQLLSYNGDPKNAKNHYSLQDQSIGKKELPAEKTRSKLDFHSDVEMKKKMAIIRAARALMKILDA